MTSLRKLTGSAAAAREAGPEITTATLISNDQVRTRRKEVAHQVGGEFSRAARFMGLRFPGKSEFAGGQHGTGRRNLPVGERTHSKLIRLGVQ